MKIALSSKIKLGFIDGSYAMPATESPLLIYWNRCNDIVISWILNTVTTEIRNSIMYLHSAKAIWSDLFSRFSQTNIPKLFNLRKEISCLNQGNLSISAYFTKYRSLIDELDALSEFPKCNCGKCTCDNNLKLDNYMKSTRLAQFLMGLNDQYTIIRGHILMMLPPPSLSEAYGLLMQEENQRDKTVFHTTTLESSAMVVKPYIDQNRGGQRNVTKKPSDSTLYCDFCQVSDHSRDKCFCIHGYPEWHKMFGKPKPKPRSQKPSFKSGNQAHNVANSASSLHLQNSSTEEHKVPNPKESGGFSENQCKQILSMIQTSLKELNHHSSNAAIDWPSSTQANLSQHSTHHFAGPQFEEDYRDW